MLDQDRVATDVVYEHAMGRIGNHPQLVVLDHCRGVQLLSHILDQLLERRWRHRTSSLFSCPLISAFEPGLTREFHLLYRNYPRRRYACRSPGCPCARRRPRQAAVTCPRPHTNICLIRPAVRLDICPMTEASRPPDDRPGASARPAGARSGRGRRVPRKEHVTLRRLTLGSRKYFSFLVAVGLLVATVAGFGVSNLTAGPFGHFGMTAARADTCDDGTDDTADDTC